MNWFDTKTLFDEADARNVVKRLFDSTDYHMSGTTMFCRCPSGHKETRLNHCAVYKDGCKCFSCNERYGIKDMVEKYYLLKGQALTFTEICELVADTCGGRDRFLIKKEKKKKKDFPLNREELSLICLSSPEWEKDVPKLSELYRQDEKLCKTYLVKRAQDVMAKVILLKDSDNKVLAKVAEEREKKIEEIINILSKTPEK